MVFSGETSSDKLIGDNTGGVWLPVVEPRPGAGFTHLKLLSETARVRRDVEGVLGGIVFVLLPLALALINPDFQVLGFIHSKTSISLQITLHLKLIF